MCVQWDIVRARNLSEESEILSFKNVRPIKQNCLSQNYIGKGAYRVE